MILKNDFASQRVKTKSYKYLLNEFILKRRLYFLKSVTLDMKKMINLFIKHGYNNMNACSNEEAGYYLKHKFLVFV